MLSQILFALWLRYWLMVGMSALLWRVLVGIKSRGLVDVINLTDLFCNNCNFFICSMEMEFTGIGGYVITDLTRAVYKVLF